MNRSSGSVRALAVAGAALAGYVDAIGFIETGGYFVSFMSGNSTQLALGFAGVDGWAMPALVISCFVAGVTLGSLAGRRRAERQVAVVFALVAAVLAAAAGLEAVGLAGAAMLVVAVAMGMENAAIEANGEVRIGLTYMTGTLVKLGQHLASALEGGPRWAWSAQLVLWGGMVLGAVAGAVCHPLLGIFALWPAVAVAGALSAAGWLAPERFR